MRRVLVSASTANQTACAIRAQAIPWRLIQSMITSTGGCGGHRRAQNAESPGFRTGAF
jgi:hypothetical protein